MPATPKSLRQAPSRRFENYILTRETGPHISLANVQDSLFLPCGPASSETSGENPGVGFVDNGLSSPIEIGFDFQIDGVVYKKFVACTNGWMVLVDPSLGTFASSSVLSGDLSNNSAILLSGFGGGAQHMLLAPWFDDLRNVAASVSQLSASYTLTKSDRVTYGLEAPAKIINPAKNSVKFFSDKRSAEGRRLIVRWNSLTGHATATKTLKFESVIYENGKIEFRYAPRQEIDVSQNVASLEDATIGIFAPNGRERFRDFSPGLGYRDNERVIYRYGGSVMSSYTDTAESLTSYTCNLKSYLHWPGLFREGSKFVFAPPLPRKRVLPRSEIILRDSRLNMPTVARTGNQRLGSDTITFDDRRSVKFTNALSGSGSLVNYPTTLPRFFGQVGNGTETRQSLFSGDFELTASVSPGAIDQFISIEDNSKNAPFVEHKLYENGVIETNDEFYSGSNITEFGLALNQPLKAKTQLRLSFPVNYTVVMFGTSSAVYYYNNSVGSWNVPQNSSYTIPDTSITNNSGYPKGDIITSLANDSVNRRILEDIRGFGPIGNFVASGSRQRSNVHEQSDQLIGSFYTPENVTLALNKQYDKSITVNEDYRATSNEVFRLPINHPFLIEKAIIEVPLAAGDGWFNDRTTCLATHENTPCGFDFAGPALTVALLNQVSVGNSTRRDIILTGTITHDIDNVSEIVFSAFPPVTSTFQIRPRGFRAFNATPGAVVVPASSSVSGYTFTGSVPVQCEAQAANGVVARVELAMTSSTATFNRRGVLEIFNKETLTLTSSFQTYYSQSCYIAYVNNFGRSGTGFDPSGRSIFGKEFVTTDKVTPQGTVANPFYLTGTIADGSLYVGIPTDFSQSISTGTAFKFELALPLEASKPSPYLVMPTDNLVLAVSKTRPVYLGSQAPVPGTSGSIQHDIQLITGSIHIVLYGSLLREGKEFHDTLNQPLASEAIHEVLIGNEPVIDQYEIAYRDAYINGIFDDYVTGSMVAASVANNGQITLVTGSRSKVFSKFSPRSAGYPSDSSLSFSLQPWFERSGTPRVSTHDDIIERYWDSMMPSISDALSIDGNDIWIPSTDAATQTGLYPGGNMVASGSVGWAIFNFSDAGLETITNTNWQMGFPFEPRYAALSRQKSTTNSLVAKRKFSFSGGVSAINPVQVKGLMIMTHRWTMPTITNRMRTIEGGDFYVASDIIQTSQANYTGSMSSNDIARFLYGFGDNNTVSLSDGGQGANNFPEMRVTASLGAAINDRKTYYMFGPIIRGWKHGVYSGLPAFSKAYFRQQRFGQFRDMLEQRPFTKFYITTEKNPNSKNFQQSASPPAVTVKFVDATGKLTRPENTWSQNLSFEATSSVPFFDGESRDRPQINVEALNANIVTFSADQFGQITL